MGMAFAPTWLRQLYVTTLTTAAGWTLSPSLLSSSIVVISYRLCGGYIYDSTSIQRPFDCLSKVI